MVEHVNQCAHVLLVLACLLSGPDLQNSSRWCDHCKVQGDGFSRLLRQIDEWKVSGNSMLPRMSVEMFLHTIVTGGGNGDFV